MATRTNGRDEAADEREARRLIARETRRARRAMGQLYDRLVRLAPLLRGWSYRHGDLNTFNCLVDTGVQVPILLMMLEEYPDREQWVNGNLVRMDFDMQEKLRQRHKAQQAARRAERAAQGR